MITEQDLAQAIAECQGERNPNANTCIKLAAFYTIRDAMFGRPEPRPEPETAYSFAAAPAEPVENLIDYYSDTDFSRVIDGRKPADVWPVIDDLMTHLQIIEPRLYNAVMRQLQA